MLLMSMRQAPRGRDARGSECGPHSALHRDMAATTMADGGRTTVRSLLEHFRDDPKLQPLFEQLDELSKRVEVADAQNTLDPRTRPLLHHSASASSQSRSGGLRSTRSGLPATTGGRPNSTGHLSGGTTAKIEDASLPIPPLEVSMPLSSPPGGHDWEAMQEPVSLACAQFSSPAAKATWKQWALTPHNVDVVVAVAWWVVAHVFRPDHPLSPAVKEHVFRFFARRYALDVLSYGGACKDLYHNLWQSVVASACTNLLRSAYPRSAHKVDAHLEEFVRAQLVRWTAGILPLDLHPSDHELVGLGPPAAHTHHQRHAQRAGVALGGGGGSVTQQLASLQALNLASLRSSAGAALPVEALHLAGVVSGAVASPTAQMHLPAGPGLASSVSACAPASTSPLPSPSAPTAAPDSRQQAPGPAGASQGIAAEVQGGAQPLALLTTGFDVQQASPAVAYLFEAHALSPTRKQEAALPGVMAHTFGAGQRSRRRPVDGAVALPPHQHIPGKQGGGGGGDQRARDGAVQEPAAAEFSYAALAKESCTRAADAVKRYEQCKANTRREVATVRKGWLNSRDALHARVAELSTTAAAKDLSDRLSNWIENDVDRMLRDQPVATKHIQQQHRLGATASAPIDAAPALPAAAQHGGAPGVLIPAVGGAHAANDKRQYGAALSATEAVLKAGGGASAGAAAMSGAAASVGAGGSSQVPGYLTMTAATVAGAGCASASFLAATAAGSSGASGPSMTRIMQPWSKMRSVEAKIRGTLSQARHGSNDLAAHLHTVAKDKENRDRTPGMPGNGLRGRAWRPAPVEYTRGTLDVRLRHQVLKALRAAEI